MPDDNLVTMETVLNIECQNCYNFIALWYKVKLTKSQQPSTYIEHSGNKNVLGGAESAPRSDRVKAKQNNGSSDETVLLTNILKYDTGVVGYLEMRQWQELNIPVLVED